MSQVGSSIPNDEPFGNAHNNWSFPGLTRVELMEDAQSVLDSITDHDEANLGEAESRLQDYIRRLQHLRQTRSEEHTSELQSLMRISYAVFCLKKKNNTNKRHTIQTQ